uniref:Mitochondrial carrier protein n=1 Tax=Tetradesmus obliquus TaxID=3088 RepID=A0A383VG02_TETOB
MAKRDPFPGEKFLYGGMANALGGPLAAAAAAAAAGLFANISQLAAVNPAAAVAAELAGLGTNPADVLKVRLQMQNELGAAAGRQAAGPAAAAAAVRPQLGLLQMLKKVVNAEGPAALMYGWQASAMRELSYSAIRMGLYDEVKELLAVHGDDRYSFPLWKKIVAGGISGCIGAAIASPTDLVKIRAQALNPATGRPFYSYPSPWAALGIIYRTEGGIAGMYRVASQACTGGPAAAAVAAAAAAESVLDGVAAWCIIYHTEGGIAGMYRGVVPTVQRAMVLTATQFATYDEVKYLLIGNGLLEEGVGAHIASSITAGLAVATTTNPLDLVKSRYMNQEFDKVTGKGLRYSGVADCLMKTLQAEGLRGLYKGWLPNWLRIGPHTVITFLSFEALRKAAGLEAV